VARRDISRVGGQLDMREALGSRLGQEQSEGLLGVARSPLPGDHGKSDMTQDVRGQRRVAALPAKADGAAELSIPDPATEAGKTGHQRSVRQANRRTLCVAVIQTGDEAGRVPCDPLELLLSGLNRPQIIGRPVSLQRRHISRQPAQRWINKCGGRQADGPLVCVAGAPTSTDTVYVPT
jgi:hypothetical protein